MAISFFDEKPMNKGFHENKKIFLFSIFNIKECGKNDLVILNLFSKTFYLIVICFVYV